jgi:hypothetical protein
VQIFRFIFRFDCSFAFVWLKVGRLCAAGFSILIFKTFLEYGKSSLSILLNLAH